LISGLTQDVMVSNC